MSRLPVALTLLFVSFSLSAQPFDPFQPRSAIVMGRGGSFTATASGYNSFFYNPAGFARRGELTAASANLWAFMDRDMVSLTQQILGAGLGAGLGVPGASVTPRALDPAALESLQGYFADLAEWAQTTDPAVIETIIQNVTEDAGYEFTGEDDLLAIIAAAGMDDIIAFLEAIEAEAKAQGAPLPFTVSELQAAISAALPSGFLRVGGQIGLGYVGNGLGLGLFANAEATLDGTSILQAYGTAYNTITFVGGAGLSFGSLHVGVSLRPTVFGYSRVAAAPLVVGYLTGAPLDLSAVFANTVYYGSGLGIDLGALWQIGPVSLGLAAKDVFGTRINYRKSGFSEYLEALRLASLPVGSELSEDELRDAWRIPMKVNAGVEFHPDLGVVTYLFDPSVSVDLLDVTSMVRTLTSGETVTPERVLKMLNVGGQVNLLRYFSVRAGYYGGYLSAGLGVRALFLDINAAVAGDFGRTDAGWAFTEVGGSVELALRF